MFYSFLLIKFLDTNPHIINSLVYIINKLISWKPNFIYEYFESIIDSNENYLKMNLI